MQTIMQQRLPSTPEFIKCSTSLFSNILTATIQICPKRIETALLCLFETTELINNYLMSDLSHGLRESVVLRGFFAAFNLGSCVDI